MWVAQRLLSRLYCFPQFANLPLALNVIHLVARKLCSNNVDAKNRMHHSNMFHSRLASCNIQCTSNHA